jgi:hypothetical protein
MGDWGQRGAYPEDRAGLDHVEIAIVLAVDKARLRYRSLLLITNFKVALQVESTIQGNCPHA